MMPGLERHEIQGVIHIRIGGAWIEEALLRERPRLRKPSDLLPSLAVLRTSEQEIFMVVTLDGSHKIIAAHEVTKGLANSSQVHPRETYRCALKDNAVGLVVAHNHPSGSLDPSAEDLVATRRLAEAGRLMGIPLLDHLIITAEGYTSLRERFPDYFLSARGYHAD